MRVVWHCADRVGADMAGPGIRAVELARRLAARHDVALAAPGAPSLPAAPFEVREPEELAALLRGADVLVSQGFDFPLPLAFRFRGRLVLDLYDPVQLEQLAQFGPGATAQQRVSLAHVRARLLALLRRADHVLCASREQRAFWLGWLAASGRLGPAALDGDPEARRLLAVAPFGLPEEPPRAAGHALRDAVGVRPGVPLALFWGGLWDWMDPALAVEAIAELRTRGRSVHLAFLAGARPGGDTMRAAADQARAAVVRHDLSDRVHFLGRWIPYAMRGAFLLDADVAVAAHRPSLESELAFRTRLLDCLWARLPAACTRGDALAAEAEREGWGRGADPGDARSLADALDELLQPEARGRARSAAERVADRYRWSRSAETILDLLDGAPPARGPLYVPGEAVGLGAVAFARALGEKVAARLSRGRRGRPS